ncbi:fatty acyl-CoA reductase 3-like isoform X2 [Lycium barbarum]|uniref:fatty acyl-CoA reductase 3-like isoform X2 n=1 Tax=Lycium barbarum TaxID=112863 RepID=UPI00293ED2C2|nr:fatty acyl-CoA reductase 3-like isoform X2 [Lycium barbarum]
MELTSVLKFLENRTILVVGATGFLAKIFVEKILRVQPNAKKLYLLLRAQDNNAALQRFNNEAVAKDLFKLLREKHGANLNNFISQRTTILPGDITCDENLGVKDSNLLEEMWKEVEAVVNLAATTNFDERARKYGWPNPYVFTKALAEMLLGDLKEEVPLVILRPTIVTSTFQDPFPGWVEGIRTIDSLAVGYGKGKLTSFVGDPQATIDVIPADMVVNAMIVSMVAHADQRGSQIIYHVGTSVSNPVEFTLIQDCAFHYFKEHPWIDKQGKPVIVSKVNVLSSMDSFHRYMVLHYLLPLKGLEIVNTVLCQFFQAKYLELHRKIKFVMRLLDLYGPYLFFKGIYDDMNTEKLRRAAKEAGIEMDAFNFNPKSINWEDYFLNTHIPGVVKYVFK